MSNIAAIILAAGRGTRMNSTDTNKVMSLLNGKPLLSYSLDNLAQAGFTPIITVVGFAKESIMNYFGNSLLYAEQTEFVGTANALACGLKMLPKEIENVLSIHGDDSYLYSPKILTDLRERHINANADVTMLTVDVDDPTGLGRILRKKGKVVGIVEERIATEEQKKIHEINPGCFIFKRHFIENYLPKIKKNPVAQEYYVTDIIEVAVEHNKKIETVRAGKIPWRGVNRPEELEEARKLLDNKSS